MTGFTGARSVVSLLAVSLLVLSRSTPAVQPAPLPAFQVLLTNDDGFDAPGLQALVAALSDQAVVDVAAPAQNQTATGHALTLLSAVIVRERAREGVRRAFAIDGTPATCVRLALDKYLPDRPDLVVSGINPGENLGTSVYLSGTVGAAREAAFSGIPAVAVSMAGDTPERFAAAAAFVRALVAQLRATRLIAPGLFLNVNVPSAEPRGTAITRLGLRPSRLVFDCTAPAGDRSACFPGYRQQLEDEPGTDIGAFYKGYATVTPMTLDVTAGASLDSMRVLERGAGVASVPR
jgi:5'-nucleotidase